MICSMEFETVSVNFSFSATLKSVGSFCIWMVLLSVHDFVTFSIDYWKNITSLGYTGLPSVDTFHLALLKKTHLLISLIRKVFMDQDAIKLTMTEVFQNSLFLLESLNLIIDNRIQSVVVLEETGLLCLCSR